ncbi:flavin reductase [Acinetobacter lwoffii]|uniref:flavin reductase n=1 Tax=Acinetobacter lwoffii TaxID=28090 RepID=UPI000A321BA1|nr:flavin reductase [Acinetobacter lwoffii]AUC08500.1 flavin reductase [Acinetobacter lwoffii]MCO8063321.1 flavin reductase [Acinetobacter lwoffii]MCO8086557.1 flavin reductase [Acinetobacter lwoffii]
MIEATDFRNAMSLLTTAVNVITTSGETGMHGFTASAVCSVTDTPPTLLVCMNQSSRSHAYFFENKVLAVNVLSTQHEQISNAFASSKFSSEDRFKLGDWSTLETSSPILEDALVSFDCQIENIQQVGTHSIFLCRVLAVKQSDQEESLVYFNRAYHQVGQLEHV